jgi:4-hydroxybenzoate polyprenyltransferase
MVQEFGISRALWLARLFHAVFVSLLIWFGVLLAFSSIYFVAVAIIALSLLYEHAIVRPDDLRRVNAAFFAVNGVISVFFLLVIVVEVFWRARTPI